LRIELLQEIPEGLGPQWNALVQRMERPEIFYSHEWALAVCRSYQASITPLLCLAYEGDDLVGLAALATDHELKQTFFLTGTTADYCDFISPESCRACFANLVVDGLKRLNLPPPVLANVPTESATARVFERTSSISGARSFSRPAYACAQISLEGADERKAARHAVLSQKTLRYSLRSLEKKGPVVVEHLTSDEGIRAALPEFVEAHVERLRSTGRTSHLSDPRRQFFLNQLARLLSPRQYVVLTRLLVGDRPIAWNYGFQFAGTWFYYQPTFLNEWRRFSPGICLLAKIVEAAVDNPEIKRVDLGLGAESYKQRFTTSTRRTLHITLTNSRVRRLREVTRYRLAAAIKSNAYAELWVRRLLRRRGNVPA